MVATPVLTATAGLFVTRHAHYGAVPILWGERQLRSVANMTRQDAGDFIALAHDLNIRPSVTTFSLKDADRALRR
jgi:D-arabinose 1-dehydrogenase-like Zn-dependent alcohol dehydrogenase